MCTVSIILWLKSRTVIYHLCLNLCTKNMLPAHLNHCPRKKLKVGWILEKTGKQGGEKKGL